MSGLKLACLYGLIPNLLGFCGPPQKKLKKFIKNKISVQDIIPVLEKFEAAFPYYQLIAQKNGIHNPFNKKVVEAYWLGNELLEKITAKDLRQLIINKFSLPNLLSKKEAVEKAKKIPANSKPHHSFHVLIIGSITGRINLNNLKLQDICRIGWGKIIRVKKNRLLVSYNPLTKREKIIELGQATNKEIIWDKDILPKIKTGDYVSFHWDYAIQKINKNNISNLRYYTQNTLNSLYGKKY